MGISQHRVVGAYAEHDRFRFFPMPVQVEHAWLVAAEHPLDPRAVPPRHRPPPGDLLDQAIVVGRGERDTQVLEGFQNIRLLCPQGADRLTQPAPVLPTGWSTETNGYQFSDGQKVV